MRFLLLFPLVAVLLASPAAMTAKTRVGFIGLKHSHCWRQLQNVAGISEVEFVGVAEPEPELVEEAKKYQPDAYYVDDYRKLVEEKKPQIVWAFVENDRHLEVMEYLAPLGVHVIFEKPLAASFEDAKKIRDLAREHSVEVMTNYQMAWWATNQEIKRQADSGAVGDVWRLHGIVGHGGPGSTGARSKFFFEWLTDPVKNGGGALIDFGCYNALWSLWIKGRPQSVFAQANHLQPDRFPKVEDNSVMVLAYPDGVSILEGSWDLPHSFQDLEIFGREGSLYMTRQKVELRKGRRGAPESIPATQLSPERSDPILYMVDRVEKGLAVDNIMALDINVAAVEILDAAKESIRTGRTVMLK